MKNLFIYLILSVSSVHAGIIPDMALPSTFDESKHIIKTIKKNAMVYYVQETDQCNNVVFNEYYLLSPKPISSPGYHGDEPESIPVSQWLCLFANDVYDAGYNSGVKEQVIFDKKNKSWKLIKNENPSKTHKNTQYIPLKLYNIESKNAKGFAVTDQNITDHDKSEFRDDNVKKTAYFCMIHDDFSLCGIGNLIRNIDGKEVDFTPYLLKSLESMELSVKE